MASARSSVNSRPVHPTDDPPGTSTPRRKDARTSSQSGSYKNPSGRDAQATPLAMTSPPANVLTSPSSRSGTASKRPPPLQLSPPSHFVNTRPASRSSSSESESADEEIVAAKRVNLSSSSRRAAREADALDSSPVPVYALSKSQPPSASSPWTPRTLSGLGLGLPFSASSSKALSSILQPGSSQTNMTNSSPTASPMARSRSSTNPGSPAIDRNQLIGLGELATPRWTSGQKPHQWSSPTASDTQMPSLASSTNGTFPVRLSLWELAPSPDNRRQLDSSMSSMAGSGWHLSSHDSTSSVSALAETIHPATMFPPSPFASQHSLESLTRSMPDSLYSLDAMSTSADHESQLETLSPAIRPEKPLPEQPLPAATQLIEEPKRRVSTGSTSSSKRSSTSKAVEAKSGRSPSHRRQSGSRGSFSHLPPSPAVPFAASTWATTADAPPLPDSLPSSNLQTPAKAESKSMRRSSSNYASPSAIAAGILRQTRELEKRGADYDSIAASNSGTAEALRKLDGLSSPRSSRNLSGPTSSTKSRASSRSGSSPAPKTHRDSVDSKAVKSKSRASSRFSAHDTSKDAASFLSPPSKSREGQATLTPTSSSAVPRSPLLINLQHATPSTVDTSTKPSPEAAQQSPNAAAAVDMRNSSSSTTAGTLGSMTDSRQSFSGSSFATTAPRSASSKNRRSSMSSDVSSTHSNKDDTLAWAENATAGLSTSTEIPPVPPIPKDWNTSQSKLTPTEPATEASPLASRSNSSSSPSVADDSAKKSRKWSISHALAKATKSPRLSYGLKESTSMNALPKTSTDRAAGRSGDLLSQSSRRFVNSTNDIASLAREPTRRTTVSRAERNVSDTTSNRLRRLSTTQTLSKRDDREQQAGPSSTTSSKRPTSNIPFFSRKSSSASVQSSASSSVSGEPDERSGRRSIMGLGFLRTSSSKKERNLPPSPNLPKRYVATTMPATANELPDSFEVDELGRRMDSLPLQVASAGRPRGKTVGASDDHHERPVHLPPHHVSDLSQATRQKVATIGSTRPLTITESKRLHGTTTVGETERKTSAPDDPSSQTLSVSDDQRYFSDVGPANTPPPISRTPTRIPRLNANARSSAAPSPALTPQPTVSTATSTLAPSVSTRQLGRAADTHSATLAQSTGSLHPQAEEVNEFGVQRDPALALGERSLASRRRLDGDTSQIPRSKSTKAPLETTSHLSRSASGLPRSQRTTAETAGKPLVVPASSIKARAHLSTASSVKQSDGRTSSSTSSSAALAPKRATVGPEKTRRVISGGATAAPPVTSKSGGAQRIARTVARKPVDALPTGSNRSSTSSPGTVDEDEVRGDAEMAAFVRRQQTRRLAAGSSAEAVRDMFTFPEPTDAVQPLSPIDASLLYGRSLSEYEKEEILQYPEVYFVGQRAKKNMAKKEKTANNFGYDDERGDYLIIPHDHILYRYEVIDVLGKGSFGQVLQCRDHKTGEMVAVKIIRNKKRFHHQALVEVKVLENLVEWDPNERHYVIRMTDSFVFRGHLCIVTELLSINLYELVKANNFAGFTTTLIRRFTTQILASLCLLRHHRVVHCDLKPENILLKHPAKSGIKVIDFGSSCFEHEKVYTYIQSRFYRSPEVILGMNYHMAIDMWSLGCIIAEMYTGYPIFPGENEQEQLACIMEVMGLPDKYLIERASRRRLFFDSTGAPRPVVNSKGRRRRANTKTLAQVLRTDDDLFVDFIAKCLIWDPEKRLKPDAALRHPWIKAANSRIVASMNSSREASRSSSSTRNLASTRSAEGTPRKSSAASTPTQGEPVTKAPASTAPRLTSKASLALSSSSRYAVK